MQRVTLLLSCLNRASVYKGLLWCRSWSPILFLFISSFFFFNANVVEMKWGVHVHVVVFRSVHVCVHLCVQKRTACRWVQKITRCNTGSWILMLVRFPIWTPMIQHPSGSSRNPPLYSATAWWWEVKTHTRPGILNLLPLSTLVRTSRNDRSTTCYTSKRERRHVGALSLQM